jgi:tetratricopeptide (TPR) repeat protein
MEKIKNEEPVRPRLVDPSIPRDLETIVLKAIEKDPRRRFASAAAMAEDLRRFIDDEPIQARRTGTFERIRLWCRRNQAKASLLAALAAAVTVAFVAVTFALFVSVAARRHADERAVMEHVARQQAESALREVETQQKRADDNFARAMAVGDSCLSLIGESEALQAPGSGPLRRELLLSALRPYQQLVRDRGDDPTVRAGLAAAHLRVSKIHSQLGEVDEARLAAAQAIRLYRALAAEYPEDREISAHMAESYAIHGDFRDASRIAAWLLEAEPADPLSAPVAAEVCRAAARHFQDAGSPDDALEALRPALEFREAQVRGNPDDPAVHSALARVLDSLGVSLASRVRTRESLEVFRRAVIHARVSHAASPRDLGHGHALATALHHLGLMEHRSGRDEDAVRSFAEAIDVRKSMADGNPAVPSFQAALCHEYACLAASRRSLGREDEAERSMLLARGVIERLPDRGGDNLFVLACVHARLAAMAGEFGSMPADDARVEGRRRVELAIDALRRAVAADYDEVASLRANPDLAPLRDHAEFQALLAQIEESARVRGPRPGQARAGD